MQRSSSGVSALELIRDQRNGAATVDFKDLSIEELKARASTFPEARKELIDRVVKSLPDGTK